MECESPECPHRSSIRRRFLRSASEGVLLQGRWYCCPDCFEHAVTAAFGALLKLRDEPLSHLHRVPLGLLLLGRGVITDAQLKSALAMQRESRSGRLGHVLVNSGIVSAQDISTALAAQRGCAVFPVERDRYRDCCQLLPFALLESSRMVPVHYHDGTQTLFVAFAEDIDHTAVYSIEHQLGARTQACVITESAMEQALDDIRVQPRPSEIVFETLWDPYEIARTVRDYSLALSAEELVLARPRRFLWVRLRGSGRCHDLLFRLPPGTPAAEIA